MEEVIYIYICLIRVKVVSVATIFFSFIRVFVINSSAWSFDVLFVPFLSGVIIPFSVSTDDVINSC